MSFWIWLNLLLRFIDFLFLKFRISEDEDSEEDDASDNGEDKNDQAFVEPKKKKQQVK